LGHIKVLETALSHFLSLHGGWGLFVISFLDSSFLAFPFINDLLLIKLASLHPYKAAYYALQCTAGSVLGAFILYLIFFQGSKVVSETLSPQKKGHIRRWIERNRIVSTLLALLRRFFSRKPLPQEKNRLQRWAERNDFLSILVASLLPPPLPFKVFAIMAGGLRMRMAAFLAALVIGRGLRFGVEAWLGVSYGAAAQAYLKRNLAWHSLIIVAIIILAVLAYRRLRPSPPARG
jgi:membrane protein YqaA with SNARE-associated domain